MNFDLSEDQALFKAAVERFVAPVDVPARRALRGNAVGYDQARWGELAALGLIAIAASEEQGGVGGSITDLAMIAEALGCGNAPDPWLENGVMPVRLAADPSIAARLIAGTTIGAFAFAEPGMHYNLLPSKTTAKASGDAFFVSGEKTMVIGGMLADLFFVTADINGETAVFAIDASADGLRRHGYRLVDGSIAAELSLHEARASARFAFQPTCIGEFQLLASSEMVGLAQLLLDETLAYVKQREQFGVAIGSFQAIQHRLVECYAGLEQARSMLWRTVLSPQGDRWAGQVAGAKAYIAQQAGRIAAEAIQLHGGMGVTDELAIGHAAKRVMLLSHLFGDIATNMQHFAEAA